MNKRELAERVIKYIKGCVNKDGCYYEGTDMDLCDMADELAQAVIADDWVSVDERLPDDSSGPVSVKFRLARGDELIGDYWDHDWHFEHNNLDHWFIGNKHVTHWKTHHPTED